MNVLGIPGEIVKILPNEYQNYRDETKTMDLVFDLKSKETLNLEFKSTYVKKEDIEKSLDYATYLRIKYRKKTNSYFISTVQKKNNEYEEEWHNENKYKIPLKTFKEFSGEEHLENLKNLLEKGGIDDETQELNDLLLIPFMESDKSPKELIVECITLANQIRTVNRDKLNDIKNLLLFLATKYTDTDEEFDEIERLVKMEGGMIQNTVKQMKRIYGEKGIDSVAIELEKIGIESELIEKVTDKAKKEIQKQINRLQVRIDNLYTDKLDRKITEEFWKERHNKWYEEKEELIQKLSSINKADRTFDEGTNLLENFCKHAPLLYEKACPKTKQKILKIIGSNFTYKDKKLSVVLSSVFDLLINNPFSKNGGNDEARTRDLMRDRHAL